MDKGQSAGDDLNSYAWHALLLADPISQETLDVAQRANDFAKNSFATQHTLACVYAQAGKTSQAHDFLLRRWTRCIWRNLILKSGSASVSSPNSMEKSAAEKIYKRVEKPKFDYPAASYAIAQQHLATMQNESKSPKSSAGQRWYCLI
jgi:hypothetical protein